MTKIRFRPMFYITLLNILGFFLLFLFSDAKEISLLYIGLGLAAANIAVYLVLFYFDFGDIYLFLTASMLVSIGLIILYRLGLEPKYRAYSPDDAHRQLLWFGIGIIAYLLTLSCFGSFRFWDRLKYLYIAMCFILLGVTAVFGTEVGGSKNWIFIGSFSIQPSEIIKIFFCLAVACFFSKIPANPKKDKRRRLFGIPKDELYLAAFVYICMGTLTLVQKEWGTALLLFLIYFSMCFIYRTNYILKLANIAGIILVFALGYIIFTSEIGKAYAGHIAKRIDAWLNPWQDASGVGYQATQSLMAIANGGYFGTGLGRGMPYVIPASHNDYIFAAICEELGIFTGIAVVLLYFLMNYRGVKVAIKNENEYLKAACLALVLSLGYQTFIIVAGVIKLIPLTGITLPFVSAGGSSMLTSFVMLGIITAFSNSAAKKKKAELTKL